MTRLRPPTWLTTAAGWALHKVIDAADWALGRYDERLCRLSNELSGGDEQVEPVLAHRHQNHGHSSGQLLDGSLYCIDCDWTG